jgi:hypothetical protein
MASRSRRGSSGDFGAIDDALAGRAHVSREGRRRGVRRNLHLFALSGFALAAPLLAKLGPAPGYFAAHGMTSAEIVLFALALVIVPPLVLMLIELVARLLGRRVRWIVHLLLVAALVALFALPPVGGLTTAVAYFAAGLVGIAFAGAYARWRSVRSFTTVLALGPILFLVVFLFLSPTSDVVRGNQADAWRAKDSFRPPVVFIQFDALPGLLLETPGRKIDAKRYPNFAQLARDGVWYRNASNVHENTVFSVPSFIDGKLPRKGITATVQDHYPNLFTVLGPDYRMNVAEEALTLCPYEFCRKHQGSGGSLLDDTRVVFNQIVRPEGARASLPSISHRWSNFAAGPLQGAFATRKKTPEYVIRHLKSGRLGRFNRWLANMNGGGARPELDYIHMFLPHEPREFLPDGERYRTPDPALSGPPAYDNKFLSEEEEQRTQLQLGYTDRVVGQVIAKLKRLGVYDDAFVVVVADHGESFLPPKATPAGPFVPGHLGYRRAVTRHNIADIASIPMFIKYPIGHGPRGKIDDRFVRAVDVFPTITDELGYKLPPIAGRDLQDPSYTGHGVISVGTTYEQPIQVSARRWQRERARSLRRRLRLFGSGADSLYRFGPQPSLIGRRIDSATADPLVKATVTNAKALTSVDGAAPVCECQLAGRITGASPDGMPLAIAVNGRIAATGVGFADRGDNKLNWAVMVPPSSFKDGHNVVQVFRIDGNKLTLLGAP